MKLTVEIVREKGVLQAFVIQGGKRGLNLLKRKHTRVLSAQIDIQNALRGHEIVWTGEKPDSDCRNVSEKAIATARDNYGWKSL